ncbi:MAG: zinc ribbon domain-containing protein [Rhabdochlamydiaceae bacterium]
MAFGGDVDTLSLTFGKLQYIFNGYDAIRDSFLETNALHRQGNIADQEFFDRIQESIMRFSALEFLSIKSIFEIKKALNRSVGTINTAVTAGQSASGIHSPNHSISAFIVADTLPNSSSQMALYKTESKNCPQCGSPIRKSSKFCVNCGNKI